MVVFISHISEEGEISNALKDLLEDRFLEYIEVFASSHEQSLKLGSDWMATVKSNIKAADVMIVLCSPLSVTRPWITFEAGAGWEKGIPVIPLCHSGLTPGGLPSPLNSLQGALLGLEGTIRKTFDIIAEKLSSKSPKIGDTDLFSIVAAFESRVKKSDYIKVANFINATLLSSASQMMFSVNASFGIFQDPINLSATDPDKLLSQRLEFQEMHHIFNPSASMVDFHQVPVFESFGNAIFGFFEDIKFLLNYRHIELTPQLLTVLESALQMREITYLWLTTLQLYYVQEEDELEAIKEQIRTVDVFEIKPQDRLYPFRLYYETTLLAKKWFTDYTTVINEITK